jgi:hypothetical protein
VDRGTCWVAGSKPSCAASGSGTRHDAGGYHGAGGGGWRRTVWARRGRDNKNDVRLRGKWGERCSFWTGVAEELCQVGPAEFRNFPGICRPAEKGNDFGGENKIVPELQTSQEFLLI